MLWSRGATYLTPIIAVVTAIFTMPVRAEDALSSLIKELHSNNCQGNTEVRYQSQQLTTANRKISVYFDVILRRIGSSKSEKIDSSCFKFVPEIPLSKMIAEKDGKQVEKELIRNYKGGYIDSKPISFSPEGKYILIENVVAYDEGLEAYTSYDILDTENNYQSLGLFPCGNSDFGGIYKGFISRSEILFACDDGGPPGVFEVVDLRTRSIRKPSKVVPGQKLLSYGFVSSPFKILKTQQFPPR